MLTKSQMLTRSSVLLIRSATSSDGPMALQRSVQAVVTPNTTLVGFQQRGLYSSASEQEEVDAVAPQKQELEELPSETVTSQTESEEGTQDEQSSTELSDPELEAFKEQERKRELFFKSRHEEFDPKTGAPILNYEEAANLQAQNQKMFENEPLVRRRFDMAEYNDWKKEVDRETIRTQQKIEHYKRSEELLRAIQDRLSSVKDSQSEKELQQYLLTKLGYKNQQYSDFISNQMTQDGQGAKDEAKRASILKAEDDTTKLFYYNDGQVRDSANLGFSTAWDKDAYTPSSIGDKAPYHKERKIMTHQEFLDSRDKDALVLKTLQILWDGPGPRISEDQHLQYYNYKNIAKMIDEDGSIRKELFFDKPMTKSELEANELDEPLQIRTFRYQVRKAEAISKQYKEQMAKTAEQKKTLQDEKIEAMKQLEAHMAKEDDIPSDQIKTDQITLTEEEIQEQGDWKQARVEQIIQEVSSTEELEEQISKIPGPWTFERRDKVNEMKDNHLKRIMDLFNNNPEQFKEVAKLTAENERLSEELSDLEANYKFARKFRTYKPPYLQEVSAESQLREDYIFFEKRQLYYEFAQEIMRENTAEMSKEEADIIVEMQDKIRANQRLPESGLNPDLFMMDYHDFRKIKPDRDFLDQINNNSILMTPQTANEMAVPDISYDKILKQEKGTYEGSRRFERIDRVSLDVSKNNFDKLKLEGKVGRVYDFDASMKSIQSPSIIRQALSLGEHMEQSLIRVREKDEDDGRYKDLAYLDDGTKTMPEELTEEQQAAWTERQEQIEFQKKLASVDGNVDRNAYIEDWINRQEGSQQIGIGGYDQELHMVGNSGIKEELDAQFEQAKVIEAEILERRQTLAKKLKEQKEKLDEIFEGHETLRKKLIRNNAANFEQQLAPGETKHDFLKDEKLKRYGPARILTTKSNVFSPESTQVADYEAELYQISQNGLHKTNDQRDSLLSQFEYVFDALNQNKLPITPMIRARMFEYLTIRNDIEQANTQLQRLTTDMTEQESPIDIHYLRYHLNNCLKHDKIDGIAYLTNYFDRYQVDCSDMPLHRFHSMLDYYLNHNFDMSKVLIFCKFYRQYYTNSIRNGLSQVLNEGQKPGTMDELQIKQLKDTVFSKNDSLIDMRSLAKFLVKKTGDKQIIDPKTGEDQFWSLVQMFTQSADVYQASSLAKNNHIEPGTVAEYFGNRLNYPNSLDRVMKVAVRLGDTKAGKEFSIKMLEQIKSYQTTRNGELPQSFTKGALKDLFAKLCPQRESLSSNTSELLLYLLQQKGMHAEVINYCDQLQKHELAKYYLTESLLHLPLKSGTYTSALEKANVLEANDNSAMNLTQRTKAVMLDKGPEAAYAYFQDEFAKMEEKAKQQKALLVSLYDMLMSGEKLEFQEFKDRYLHSQMLASRLAKESFVVNQMEKLLKDKDYNQVEAAFNLYAVMREERLLEKAEFIMNPQNSTDVTRLQNATSAQKQQLQEVRKRRRELEIKVGLRDVEICASIAQVLQDDLITVFSKAGSDQIKKVASVFQDLTQEEAATIEQRNHDLTQSKFDDSSVISDLESQGFELEKIEKLYDLLDFNPHKSEGKLTNKRREDQRQKYQRLSNEDKQLFDQMQKSFSKNVSEIVRTKFTLRDALAIIRKVESNPDNAGLKNMYYQPDYSHSDKSDIELIEAEKKFFKDEREKEKRHQQQFIDKLQDQYQSFNMERIMNRDDGSDNTDEISDLVEDEEITEAQAAEAYANDPIGLKDLDSNDEELINAKLDEYAEKAVDEIDQALINAGLADKNGQLSPVLRAALMQTLIHIEEDERFRQLNSDTDITLSESDLSETELFDVFKTRMENAIDQESLKRSLGTKYAHEISDLSEQEDENNPRDVLLDFWQTVDANTDFYLKERVQELITPKINREYIRGRIRRNYRTKYLYERMQLKQKMHFYPKIFTQRFKNAAKMEEFRKQMLDKPLGPQDMADDPEVLAAEIYDATVFTLKEKLLFAINKRKYEALPLAIQVFNQIQGKQLGERFRLEDFEQNNVHDFTVLNEHKPMDVKDVEVKNIGQTMQKLDLLLNDSRSPIISTLVDTSKYKQNKLPEDVEDYYKDSESYTREPLDIGAYERDLKKLQILQDEVVRIEKTADLISERVKNGLKNVDGALNEKVLAQKRDKVKEMQDKNHQRIRKLYEDFSASFKQAEELDEHKVRVMRDVLALELGQSFNVNYDQTKTASQFPVFFALDMINFGIKRKQPAAVRLGEKLLSESCPAEQAKLPRELAMSIKNFMLDYDNNMQYREAMKLTGPINSSRIYHLANQQSSAQGITYCLDDPYWQEFTAKNRRREDQWRNPSIFAYRYKQYGILGEVIDMHSVQKKYDMAFSRPL